MLTPEREAELRRQSTAEWEREDGWRDEDTGEYVKIGTRKMRVAGADKLRDLFAEIDALCAKVAALEEAGDGLANASIPCGTKACMDARARWREVREGK